MSPQILISIILLLPALVASYNSQSFAKSSNECDCHCSKFLSKGSYRELSFCQKIERLEEEVFSLTKTIEERTQYMNEIMELRERLEIQEDEINNLKKERTNTQLELLPTPQHLLMKPEDEILNDSLQDESLAGGDNELAKNVSSLLAKMEEVESRTTQVQEDLKSERRVRRHLEEDLNETRSSIKILDDKLYNMTSPMDSRVTHVEEVVFSTLENMNKTFFEDHLQKLYYKVDGVVYKNETKKIDERLDLMQTELHEFSNSTAVKEFTDELKTLADRLQKINQTVAENIALGETRLDVLEMKAKNLEELEDVDDRLANLLNITELMQGAMTEQWSDILDIRNKTIQLEEELANQAIQVKKELTIQATQLEKELTNQATHLEKELTNQATQLERVLANQATQLEKELSGQATQLEKELAHRDKHLEKELANRDKQIEKELANRDNQLDKELVNRDKQLASVTESVKLLNNLTAEVNALKSNASKTDVLLLNLQREVSILAADIAIAENRIHDLSSDAETRMQDVNWKIANLSETLDSSISAIVTHFIEQQNVEQDSTENPTDYRSNTSNIVVPDGDESSNRARNKGAEPIPCTLPSFSDAHLLVSMEEGPNGHQQLEFGCRPIGTYVLDRPSVPLRCSNGAWVGPFPSCMELLNAKEIDDLAMDIESKNPCLLGSGEFPDPTNCSRFFKCWSGNAGIISCPPLLHFDKVTKRCEYPYVANCFPHVTEETERIRNLIPTIQVVPNNVDKPYGLMGTSDAGHLIVYPSMRFSLVCLFPDSRWGAPSWTVEHFLPVSITKEISTKSRKNSLTLNVVANSREDSGIYMCLSPFGKQNSITVLVEDVTCPAAELGPGSPIRDAIYIPVPEGAYRILSTPVDYMCEGGRKITAYCQANGKWSRPPPTPEECLSTGPTSNTNWGCPPINTENHPDLILERSEKDMTITFKCAGNKNLIGMTFTRCYNGTWGHTALPRCKPRL